MAGFYSYGLCKKYPETKPFPLFKEFSAVLPIGEFYEALSADGDRDIVRFLTGSKPGLLEVYKSSVVEIEHDDLSLEEVDFYELWDAGGAAISTDLWSMISADILVPHEHAGRTTFRNESVCSIWTAMELLRTLRDDPSYSDGHGEIGALMSGFARAIEMQVIVTIS